MSFCAGSRQNPDAFPPFFCQKKRRRPAATAISARRPGVFRPRWPGFFSPGPDVPGPVSLSPAPGLCDGSRVTPRGVFCITHACSAGKSTLSTWLSTGIVDNCLQPLSPAAWAIPTFAA